ncbi:MAG: Hint domain-containing protein, partial [Pseudomonadota bacterium]
MPDITIDVFAADGGLDVNGAAGSSDDFIFALGAGETITLNSASISTLTITDDEDVATGDLDGDAPFPGAPNEQAPAGSNQTTDIGAGSEPLYVDFQYTVTAGGQSYTIYVIDVGNSPSASVEDNIAVTFIAFDHNNPPPFDTPLVVQSFQQTTSLPYSDLICFCPGAQILTAMGEVPVEELTIGDLVKTRDNGHQPIRFIARRELSRAEVALKPHLKPVIVRSGALGPDLPKRDLRVSPQHRFVLSGRRCELLFGEREVFASAHALLNDKSIRRAKGARRVEYIHLMFD